MSELRNCDLAFFRPPSLSPGAVSKILTQQEWSVEYEDKIEYALSADEDMDFDWQLSNCSSSELVLGQLDEAFARGNKVALRHHHPPTGLLATLHFGVVKNGLRISIYGEVPTICSGCRIADISSILKLLSPLIASFELSLFEWGEWH